VPITRALDFRYVRRDALVGIAKIQFPSGLILCEVGIYQAGSRIWARPPARAWIENGQTVIDPKTGHPRWQPVVTFANHGVKSRWSSEIVQAVRRDFPGALVEPPEGQS
jgi:hypothetical protein